MNVYFIGGSPCAGKSTVAEILSKQYGLYYFKVDERLDEYTCRGARMNYEICKKQVEMSADQIWMRDPVLQCKEEFLFYEEVNDFLMEDLFRSCEGKTVITEGAAYVPRLMKKWCIAYDRYIAITPIREFQISHFKQRDWIPYVLDGCSNLENAFDNWMERDVLFAEEVVRECNVLGYQSIRNNGDLSIEELVHKVSIHFGLAG